jgi:hypothetical protein
MTELETIHWPPTASSYPFFFRTFLGHWLQVLTDIWQSLITSADWHLTVIEFLAEEGALSFADAFVQCVQKGWWEHDSRNLWCEHLREISGKLKCDPCWILPALVAYQLTCLSNIVCWLQVCDLNCFSNVYKCFFSHLNCRPMTLMAAEALRKMSLSRA